MYLCPYKVVRGYGIKNLCNLYRGDFLKQIIKLYNI